MNRFLVFPWNILIISKIAVEGRIEGQSKSVGSQGCCCEARKEAALVHQLHQDTTVDQVSATTSQVNNKRQASLFPSLWKIHETDYPARVGAITTTKPRCAKGRDGVCGVKAATRGYYYYSSTIASLLSSNALRSVKSSANPC